MVRRPTRGLWPVLFLLMLIGAGHGAASGPAVRDVAEAPAASPMFPPGALYEAFAAGAARCSQDPTCHTADAATRAAAVAEGAAGLPRGAQGVAAHARFVLSHSGHDVEPLSPGGAGLEAAIVALYATLGVVVDDALAARIHDQAAAFDAQEAGALARLIGGLGASAAEARHILPPAVAAALAEDLATTARLVTFVGSADVSTVPPAWSAEWARRAPLLAAADHGAIARAGGLAADAVTAYLTRGTSTGDGGSCDPELDLPLLFIGGPCDDVHPAGESLVLLIDRGGDDVYLGGAGAGTFAGAGVGVHIDEGDGNDRYDTATSAQGFGLAGVGILVNEGGDDEYRVTQFGQGFGVAGFGLLYDMAGDDVYLSPAHGDDDPIGTKAGSLAGFGILVDEAGTDHYHQDGLDGFVYGAAGGAGWMFEHGDGADTYRSDEHEVVLLGSNLGNFTGPVQVSGEVGGTTVLFEEGGDDHYLCGAHVRQGCQAAAGAGSLTLLLESYGSDRYEMGESISIELVPGVVVFPMGQGSGYGPSAPGGIAVLWERGGDDTYTAEKWAQGFGTAGAGFLIDDAGADTYSLGAAIFGTRGDGASWADGPGGFGHDAS